MSATLSLALLEVSNLAPSFIVADACSKAANVRILGIESTDGAAQCIKLVGPIADVQAAADRGMELAKMMGSSAFCSVLAAPPGIDLQPGGRQTGVQPFARCL